MGEAPRHYTVEEVDSTLRLVMPYRTQWLTAVLQAMSVLFVLAVLLALTWAVVLMVRSRAFMPLAVITPLMLFGLAVVGYAGGHWSIELLWQLAGRELVEIRGDAIEVHHRILGWGPMRRFPAAAVARVSVSPEDNPFLALHAPGASMFSRRAWGGRTVFRAFRRGRVTIEGRAADGARGEECRFGSSLSEGEAREIVERIERRLGRD